MTHPKRGETWNADLDPPRGHEQAGRRPVLVVSLDQFNASGAELVVVVPFTTKAKGIPWHVPVSPPEGGLRSASWAMVEMVRSISKDRLSKRLGAVEGATLEAVEDRLRILLDV